jgi:WD repeat-containing protein 45
LRVRVAGKDSSSIEQHTLEGPRMDRQNSSTSIDPLVQTNIGSNAGSSLSFMRGNCVVCIRYWFLCSE